jgi:hypothetical protein
MGYLSPRGLPPRPATLAVTDTGLVFRHANGRALRVPGISLAYADGEGAGTVYFFRVDGGVFETDAPGSLLDLLGQADLLGPLVSRDRTAERPLVAGHDIAAALALARDLAGSRYADSLYALFGQPRRAVGLVGQRGRRAGRLGEFVAGRDSLALDPARMTSLEQLRHAFAHELAHRWQAQAGRQLRLLWQGVPPIRDPKRYGYGSVSEHQAEAVAFAIHFLQTTAAGATPQAAGLLDHSERLVPGSRLMARYLALQPIYRRHPLRSELTTGRR